MAFVCQCADPSCTELLSLAREEYSGLRASEIRFGVAAGHATPDVERVIERRDSYWVTEKTGEGARGREGGER